jgi:hypothetical protein
MKKIIITCIVISLLGLTTPVYCDDWQPIAGVFGMIAGSALTAFSFSNHYTVVSGWTSTSMTGSEINNWLNKTYFTYPSKGQHLRDWLHNRERYWFNFDPKSGMYIAHDPIYQHRAKTTEEVCGILLTTGSIGKLLFPKVFSVFNGTRLSVLGIMSGAILTIHASTHYYRQIDWYAYDHPKGDMGCSEPIIYKRYPKTTEMVCGIVLTVGSFSGLILPKIFKNVTISPMGDGGFVVFSKRF